MNDDDKPCLHCLIGKVIQGYIREYDEIDGGFIIDALAEVIGDVLAGSESTPAEWEEALVGINIDVLKRAKISRQHRDAKDKTEKRK
jgi:hypothetical protein